MNKKKLTRLIAVCMACLGMGVFAFSGCKKDDGGKKSDGGDHQISGGTEDDKKDDTSGGDDKKDDPSGSDDKKDDDTSGGDKKDEETKDPVIEGPVKGKPTITVASKNELEAAYVQWTAAADVNAKWFNVYYSAADENKWTQLDEPLVRQYKDYYRADLPGLKAGTYDMKVVPVSGEGEEVTDYAAKASGIPVKAHTREGYAFVKGTSSGAYNEDGTLIDGAVVLYVTNENYSKVSVEYGGKTVTGIDNILGEGYQKKNGATKPLCVRIIGSIGSGSKLGFKAGGDLELKGITQGVTIEGIGNDATANGWGLHITACSNVEIRNLGFMEMQGTTKDGVGFEGSCDHVWVHNCDFFYGHNWGGDQKKGDGSLDTKKSSYVTHSFNHFWDSGKCNLQGMKDSSEADALITYHHNWYDHSDSRHPRIRKATVHIYNNYFDGNAKYGVGVTLGASAFVENNYFRSTAAMRPMMSSGQGTDATGDGTFSGEAGGMIKSFGNTYDCTNSNLKLLTQKNTAADNIDCYEAATRDEAVPDTYKTKDGGTTYNNFDTASGFYSYTVESAEDAKVSVERYAGRMGGGDLKFEFDNAKEDSNYDIIPELSKLITNYSKTLTLVKIGGATVSGSTGSGSGEGGEEGESGTTNPPATIDGEQIYNPAKSGAAGTYGIFTVEGGYKSKSTAVTIAEEGNVSIEQSKALKLNSGGGVSFTVDKAVTLTVYVNLNGISVNAEKYTGTASGNYFVITVELEKGSYTVKNGGSESQLYLLKITPKA